MKTNNGKLNLTSALAVVAGLILLSAVTPVKAQVINVQFSDATPDGFPSGTDSVLNGTAYNATPPGAATGPASPDSYTGTTWNENGSGAGLNTSVSGLLDSNGNSTGVGYTFADGNIAMAANGTDTLMLLDQALYGTTGSEAFTLSGLGSGRYDLYLVAAFRTPGSANTIFTINGVNESTTAASGSAWINGVDYVEYSNILATGGDITVSMASNGGADGVPVLNGFQLQAVAAVPEPSSTALLGIGALATILVGRRLKFRNE